jgi:molybdate transport system permease protein
VAIYEHVEAMELAEAHRLAAGLVVFSLIALVAIYSFRGKPRLR